MLYNAVPCTRVRLAARADVRIMDMLGVIMEERDMELALV